MYDVGKAIALRNRGYTGYQIASVMGVSKSWVYKVLPCVCGRNHRRWTEEEIDRLISMRSRGARIKRIANRLGRGENEVRIKLCRLRKSIPAEQKYALGLIAKMVREYGVSTYKAMRAIRKSDALDRLIMWE